MNEWALPSFDWNMIVQFSIQPKKRPGHTTPLANAPVSWNTEWRSQQSVGCHMHQRGIIAVRVRHGTIALRQITPEGAWDTSFGLEKYYQLGR
jgi:hypothetical protein